MTEGSRADTGADGHVRVVAVRADPDWTSRIQQRAAGTSASRHRTRRIFHHWSFHGGALRELGERVPADGGVHPADDVSRAEGIARVAATSREGTRRC